MMVLIAAVCGATVVVIVVVVLMYRSRRRHDLNQQMLKGENISCIYWSRVITDLESTPGAIVT